MDFEQIVVKEGPGLCRCCLTEGCYKDLGKEYTWMNETEVYADMLLECFDISITQHNEGPNGPNRLICEVCITRLRDACYFKKQVQDSEKKFIDMMGRGEFRSKNAGATDTVVIFQQQMKTEAASDVPANVVDAEVEFLDEEIGFADDAEDDDTIEDPEPSVSDITVSSLPIKGKRGRPKKTTAKTDKKAKIAKLDDKPKAVKSIGKDEKMASNLIQIATIPDVWAKLRRLVAILLDYSTIMPFRWFRNSSYMCYYCDNIFPNISTLKIHTKTHNNNDVQKILKLKKRGVGSRIKWDVSDISCKKCCVTFENFDNFIDHLLHHNLKFDKALFRKQFHLFKLTDDKLQCLECGENYIFFSQLLRHLSEFHTRSIKYVCDVCGKRFRYRDSIELHKANVHSHSVNCNYCDINLPSKHALLKHCEEIHNTEKLKCHICSMVLSSRYLKALHLATVHDDKKYQFKCDLCPKIFILKSKLLRHKSLTHLKDRPVTCEVCGLKLFDFQELKRHSVTHSDAKPFDCKFCSKCYRWRKNLVVHMKSSHPEKISKVNTT
ncbi:uncharacterized protein LOC142985191 isoform X9 [Anticarsia gemmatalis]|uniref:uncharacterized protein LOC142985191 isoform X9 n=1 Tax=Anticarsia gemmatalis TaxID=129554 RepID=UPI003F777C3E